MGKVKWSYEQMSHFLKVYQKYETLWNTKRFNKIHPPNRKGMYRKLLRELISHDLFSRMNLDENSLKYKIKNLRGTYLLELKKIKKSLESGADPQAVYVPQLAWFDEAHFWSDSYCPNDMYNKPRAIKRKDFSDEESKDFVFPDLDTILIEKCNDEDTLMENSHATLRVLKPDDKKRDHQEQNSERSYEQSCESKAEKYQRIEHDLAIRHARIEHEARMRQINQLLKNQQQEHKNKLQEHENLMREHQNRMEEHESKMREHSIRMRILLQEERILETKTQVTGLATNYLQ